MQSDDTGITLKRSAANALRAVKTEMSRSEPKVLTLSETLERLVACWREQQQKEGQRV